MSDSIMSSFDPRRKTTQPTLCIRHLLEAQTKQRADAIAIAAPGRRTLSYKRLLRHIEEVVPRLNSLGMGRQDCVALVLPNGPEMAAAFLSVTAGATCAPLNPSYSRSEFDYYFSDLKVRALIIQSGIDSAAIGVAQQRSIPIIELLPRFDAEAGLFTLMGRKRPRPFLQGFAHSDDVALVLHTSGTTSRPKVVPLTQANICTSAQNIADTLQLTAADRCLNVMPLFHIHGLVGALLSSLTAGASVICSPGLYSLNFFAWLDEYNPTWYTASPTIHQAILARAAANRETILRRRFRFIRSSSAPLVERVRTELKNVFQAPVIEAYGMTEASHQIASNPLPPGKCKSGSVGPPTGSEVGIMDEVGGLLPEGQRGEIVIRGKNVMLGYVNNQEANNRAFTNGWFRTGDEGFLDREGYLFITGRLKEMINCGGEKIAPCEIDEVLMSHPAVAQAATFSMPHSNLGEKPAAAIVLRRGSTVTAKEIQNFAANRFVQFKVPHPLLIVEEIPKGPTGKIQRKGLAEKLGLIPAIESGSDSVPTLYVAPRTSLERQLAVIWAEALGLERVGIRDDFFDMGGYSLLATHMLKAVELLTGKNVSPASLFHAPTVEQFANILERDTLPSSWSSLVPIQPGGSKPPVFFVHPIGGSVLWYYDLARHLGPDQPFYGLQAQGLDGTQPLHVTVEEMAAHYAKEIVTVQPHGPYLLGGLSFGGLVAFEMAQQLKSRGEEIAMLAFLDTRSPNYLRSSVSPRIGPIHQPRLLDEISRHANALASLNGAEKLHYLRARFFSKTENLHEDLKRKLQRMTNNTHRGFTLGEGLYSHQVENLKEFHRQMAKNYTPQIYDGPVTLFRAMKQPETLNHDPTLGWGGLVSRRLQIHDVPGDHTTLIREPLVGLLAEQIMLCLAKDKFAA